MGWNYHDDDLPAPTSPVIISVNGLASPRVLVYEYRIDEKIVFYTKCGRIWDRSKAPPQSNSKLSKQPESWLCFYLHIGQIQRMES
jgi:xylan 1,4-beta-xylosidase